MTASFNDVQRTVTVIGIGKQPHHAKHVHILYFCLQISRMTFRQQHSAWTCVRLVAWLARQPGNQIKFEQQ